MINGEHWNAKYMFIRSLYLAISNFYMTPRRSSIWIWSTMNRKRADIYRFTDGKCSRILLINWSAIRHRGSSPIGLLYRLSRRSCQLLALRLNPPEISRLQMTPPNSPAIPRCDIGLEIRLAAVDFRLLRAGVNYNYFGNICLPFERYSNLWNEQLLHRFDRTLNFPRLLRSIKLISPINNCIQLGQSLLTRTKWFSNFSSWYAIKILN